MSLELLLAGIAFFAQIAAWAALPMRDPRRANSEE